MIRVQTQRRPGRHTTAERGSGSEGNRSLHGANHERGPLQRAFKYLIAFKSHTFCDVGVIVPVLVSTRRGLGEVRFSCEVTWLRPGVLPEMWLGFWIQEKS